MNNKLPKRLRGPLTATQLLKARKIVAAKNAGCMSNTAYLLMRRAQPDMMPLHRVKQEMRSQNSYVPLKDIDSAVDGCRRSVREVVHKVLSNSSVKEKVLEKKAVNLRFAADGRRTTRKKTVMSVFSVMEEFEVANRNGKDMQHCIVYEGEEDYADLQETTKEIVKEMDELADNGLEIDGQLVTVN